MPSSRFFAVASMLPFFAAAFSNAAAESDPPPDRSRRVFTPDPMKNPVERHKGPVNPVPPPPPMRGKEPKPSDPSYKKTPKPYEWPPGMIPPSK